jgi:predicted GNAT family acetyltransferase
MARSWPDIPYLAWRETCQSLQLYLQIVGKYRLAHTPWLNHSWTGTFYLTARGWTTSPVPDGPGIEIAFDLLDHRVIGTSSDGGIASFALEPMTVAAFHARFVALLAELGGTPLFHGLPNEVADPVAFTEDHRDRPYDAGAVTRFFLATSVVDQVFKTFRTSFLGKQSPSHLFWGSFDLAVTRFSGRQAPTHPGGVPALPDSVTREAYSHEVASAGFWPGGGGIDYPAFYAYAYPAPAGYAAAAVEPDAAFWASGLGEFVLPYDAVQGADDPEATLLAFLESTYRAAATLGRWDRDTLEAVRGVPGRPRDLAAVPADAARPPEPAPEPAPIDPADIQREEGRAKGRYLLRSDGLEAEMTYSRAGARLVIIDHTSVPEAWRGRKIGEHFVRRAVEDARAAGRSILPLCPFAKAQFDRHGEWHDVLDKR